MKLFASVKTDKAEKYKTVMARHFERKVTVDWKGNTVHVHFPVGDGFLEVQDGWLKVACEAETDDQLHIVKEILDSHFKQFTHREALTLDWKNTE